VLGGPDTTGVLLLSAFSQATLIANSTQQTTVHK